MHIGWLDVAIFTSSFSSVNPFVLPTRTFSIFAFLILLARGASFQSSSSITGILNLFHPADPQSQIKGLHESQRTDEAHITVPEEVQTSCWTSLNELVEVGSPTQPGKPLLHIAHEQKNLFRGNIRCKTWDWHIHTSSNAPLYLSIIIWLVFDAYVFIRVCSCQMTFIQPTPFGSNAIDRTCSILAGK